MNLRSAFTQLLENTSLEGDPLVLLTYAREDGIGGRDTGAFPIEVSINSIEGRFLYALLRHLKPVRALEIGTADGCSAVHMLSALRDNQQGELVSIDIDPRAGRMVTPDLAARWQFVCGDAAAITLPQADFVFEDARHDYASTVVLLRRLKALEPKIIISHDYYRHLYDDHVGVKQAWDEVFGDEALGIHFDNTRTGLGIWVGGR